LKWMGLILIHVILCMTRDDREISKHVTSAK
jgi:hypothetical protein